MPGFVPDSPRLNNRNDPRELGNFVIASEANQSRFVTLDCFVAEPVIGPATSGRNPLTPRSEGDGAAPRK